MMALHTFNRKMHSWIAIVVAAPLIVVIVSGILLQVRKQVAWVQPTEQKGSKGDPTLTLERIFEIVKSTPGSGIETWKDIDRIDVRPGKGMLKVKTKADLELQLDCRTGEVLQVAQRRSDIIASLHEGAWFASWMQYGVFLPAAILLIVLWASGLFMFFRPIWLRRRRVGASA